MYEPRTPIGEVKTVDDVMKWLWLELQHLSGELHKAVPMLQIDEMHVAPQRPRNGMIVLADGTDWNPGAGAGFYGYRGGAWVKLG